jgi:uncharacterized membrane protein YkvA (DUF1232 family)
LLAQARLALRLIREPAVPLVAKAVPVLAVMYLIWPLDFLPDIFPVLGQLDDLGVVLAALEIFLRLSPAAPAAFHREAVAAGRGYSPMPAHGGFVDAEFRRE